MKLKKVFAIMTAALLSIPCLSGLSASAEGYNAYLAGVYGESQENAIWSFDSEGNYPVPPECTTAVIDGDGTYEVEWVMQPLLYGPRTEFMCIFIDGLNNQNYPSLQIAVDEVIVDGTAIDYTQSARACDFNYNNGEMSRVYLKDNWAGSQIADIDEYIQINDSIKVVFTVSGMGFDGSGSSGGGEDSSSVSDSESQSESESEVSSESESESQSESVPESESESVSESESQSESQSESESESESSSTSEAESSSASSSTSESEASSSAADDDGEKDEGGIKTWMILVGVLGVGAVVAAVIVIVKIRNSRYYL